MKRILSALVVFLMPAGWVSPSYAQQVLSPDGRPVGMACAYNLTLPTLSTGQVGFLQCDANGKIIIAPNNANIGALVASSNAGALAAFSRIPNAGTTTAPATTNATLIKSTAGRIYKIRGCNYAINDMTFHFTNSATAPTPGTTAVQDFFTAPASAIAAKCNLFSFDFADIGQYFSAGIGYWVSQNPQDADTTAPAATGSYSISVGYQ